MERYAHLQTLPNSPLTPLTPLSENTAFEFNFGGDGSLDVYIDSVRHKHRIEQQQELMSSATQPHQQLRGRKPKVDSPIVKTKRFSENFLKLRDVFEPHTKKPSPRNRTSGMANCRMHHKDPLKHNCQQQQKNNQSQMHQQAMPPLSFQQPEVTPRPIVKIVHTGATPQKLHHDYVVTPTNVRTPLKPRNHNIILTLPHKTRQSQQQQHPHQQKAFPQPQRRMNAPPAHSVQQMQHPHFRQASPVAVRPLSPLISKMLHERGLTMYAGVFQREEIDLFSFKLLQVQDLQQMGITNAKHCNTIMADVCYARQYL